MNCFETFKISQQYSKIIQKIQQRNDKDSKNKKHAQSSSSKPNKSNTGVTKPQPNSQAQNNKKLNVNISANQQIPSQMVNTHRNFQQMKDKSPVSTTPRQVYTPLTPLKNLLGNYTQLSPISNLNSMRIASKTIHNPQGQSYNNNISNTILNTTNVLEDNSFVSINNHISSMQQDHRVNTSRPYLNEYSSYQKTPTSKPQNLPLDLNNLNHSTPKRLFFQNNGKNNEGQNLIGRNNQTNSKKNNLIDQQNLKCCSCQHKKAKYLYRIASKIGESIYYYCSKCAIQLVEQGQKIECIPNLNTTSSSQKNSHNQTQKGNEEELLSFTKQNSPPANILSNLPFGNNVSMNDQQINNKKISQIELPSNFQLEQRESPKRSSLNQKENVFIPTVGMDDNQINSDNKFNNNDNHNQSCRIVNESKSTNQFYFDSQQIKMNQQKTNFINNQNEYLSTQTLQKNIQYPFFNQHLTQKQNNLLSDKKGTDKQQQLINVWNYHDPENQEDQEWQDLGPKLTFEGDSKRPSDQNQNTPSQQHIHRTVIPLVITNQEDMRNMESKRDQNDQDSTMEKESGLMPSIQICNQTSNNLFFGRESNNQYENNVSNVETIQNLTNINNISQPVEDTDRQGFQEIVDNDDDSQFLPQFTDQSKYYEESRLRKAEILDNFTQELNINYSKTASCLNQLSQRKKEVTKFYENQELKLQQSAQNLMQLIQSELIESIEKLRNAQGTTLSLFSEKENNLQRIYHELQSTESDVQKNRSQIIDYMEETPFNNIIQLYHQNLSKNSKVINSLPSQVLCLSKTYYLSEKKQASSNFQQGLKDILLVQEKRTTMFGNSSYASATSTPQALNTNNNSYSLVTSPKAKNSQSQGQNSFLNNFAQQQHQQQINNYHNQPRNLSQTTSMTSSRAFTSTSNQGIQQQSQPIIQQQQIVQISPKQINTASFAPFNKKQIQIQIPQNQNQQTNQFLFNQNLSNAFQQQEFHTQQICSEMSQQNNIQAQNQISLLDSFQGTHSGIHRPIISNSISSPLIKKNNLFSNNENQIGLNGNYPPTNPYMSVENHIEQIYKPEFTRDDTPSYSSVQFQRWKECEKTIVEQLMSIEQNEQNTLSGSKQDIEMVSSTSVIPSQVQGITPQNLFSSLIEQTNNAQTQVVNPQEIQKNDKKLESISEKIDNSAQDANSSYQNTQQSDPSIERDTPQSEKIITIQCEQQEQNEQKKAPNKFEDIKNNYQWMIEQYKIEQNLISSPLMTQDNRKNKKTNYLIGGILEDPSSPYQKSESQTKEKSENAITECSQQEVVENKILQNRGELQDITHIQLQQENQNLNYLNKNDIENHTTQITDDKTINKQQPMPTLNAKNHSSNNESDSSNNQTGEFQFNENTFITIQKPRKSSEENQDLLVKERSVSEGFNLTYSTSVIAGFNSINDPSQIYQLSNQVHSQAIQNQDMPQKVQASKQEDSYFLTSNLLSTNQHYLQSNIFADKSNEFQEIQAVLDRQSKKNQALNSERGTSPQAESQSSPQKITNINFINSFSQNIPIQEEFLQSSIVQNFINKESFSQNNNRIINSSDGKQNLLSESYSKSDYYQSQAFQLRNQSEVEGVTFIQSVPTYSNIYNQETQSGFSLNIQQSNEDQYNHQKYNMIVKDSFSDATYTVQQDSQQVEKQANINQEIILDLNQLHEISNDEDDAPSGSNSSKRPLMYSEIIQKIHENYNRLSQNCQKQQNLQKNQSQPILMQHQDQQQANIKKQYNSTFGNEDNLAEQSQNIQTEESQHLFNNQEQIHFEIANNLSELITNRNNENFNSFSTNIGQASQLEQSSKIPPIDQSDPNPHILISLVNQPFTSNQSNQNEITESCQTPNQENKNQQQIINTAASFNQQIFEIHNNLGESFNQYLGGDHSNRSQNAIQVGESSSQNQDELNVKQDKLSTFSSFLDNNGGVSSNIEAQIHNHINNQISSQNRSSFNKYSELIKSSPHFKTQNLTDEDSILSNDGEGGNNENEIKSTPFNERGEDKISD